MHFILIIFFLLIGCSGRLTEVSFFYPQKSYDKLIGDYKSCSGKGLINFSGYFRSRMSFDFKSQNDSTFLQFSDILGRKTFLMWITPENVIVRDMINNTHYTFEQIIDFFPLLKLLQKEDITKMLWGVIPNNKNNNKLKKNIKLKFYRKKLNNEKMALVNIEYEDKNTNQKINIDIKSRNRKKEFVDLKKFWKLLKY